MGTTPNNQTTPDKTANQSTPQPIQDSNKTASVKEEPRKDSTKPEHTTNHDVRQPEKGKQTPGEKEVEGETEEETSIEKRRVGDSDSDNEEIPGSRM